MQTWFRVAVAFVCGLLGGGVLLLTADQPRGAAVELLPPPTAAPIVIHLAGAVQQPGVYSLPPGSRVRDGLEAAGGARVEADLDALNLAAFLEDGQRVNVPARKPTPSPAPPAAASAPHDPAPAVDASQGLVNINTAGPEALDGLPGVGPVIAQRILDYRESQGPFQTIEDLLEVSGIGPATFDRLKDWITVSD